jgi:hypothetical protein
MTEQRHAMAATRFAACLLAAVAALCCLDAARGQTEANPSALGERIDALAHLTVDYIALSRASQ